MIIALHSEKYRFNGGLGYVHRHDWGKFLPDEVPVFTGPCIDNDIHDLDVEDIGTYEVWLGDCTVEHLATGLKGVFTLVLPWIVDISQKDVLRGKSSLHVPVEGLFRVTPSRAGTPIPRCKMTFYSDLRSAEVRSDESGVSILLEDPAQFFIEVENGITVLVERLA